MDASGSRFCPKVSIKRSGEVIVTCKLDRAGRPGFTLLHSQWEPAFSGDLLPYHMDLPMGPLERPHPTGLATPEQRIGENGEKALS